MFDLGEPNELIAHRAISRERRICCIKKQLKRNIYGCVRVFPEIGKYAGKGMGLAFADYDNDGFTDIFISNDTFPNYLFHNNGDGTFKEVALLDQGVAYTSTGATRLQAWEPSFAI